jgi:hypothetical protein
MDKLTGMGVIVAAVLGLVTLALVSDWWGERRAIRIRAIEAVKAPIPFTAYEESAQRLVVEMDWLMKDLDDERRARAAEQAEHELQADRFRMVVARLEWMLSLASYDPISGVLDQEGPMEEEALYRRLGGGSSRVAFHGRLLAGLTTGLYRCARHGEGRGAPKLYWLDPSRPQAVVAFDAEAKRSTTDAVLEAERTVEALASLAPGPHR